MQRVLWYAASAAFASMAVVFLLKTLAETAFLAEFGASYLPHLFVAQSLALVSSSAAYGRIISRFDALPVDLVVLLGLAAVSALTPLAIAQGGAWLFATTLVLIAISSLAFLAVWNAVTGVAAGRQARAFLPRASAAATAGAMAGGFFASGVVATLGVVWIGPVSAVILAGSGAMQLVLARRQVAKRRSAASLSREQATRRATSDLARRLVAVIVAAAVIEAVLAAVMDFGFKEVVSQRFDRERMGLFFALYYGVSNVIVLVLQIFFATRLLARSSLRSSLSLQPIALFVMSAAWLVAPVLSLVALARGAESVMKFALGRPALEIAMSPIADSYRQRIKVLVRGVFAQGGGALAGVLLLAAAPFLARYHALVPATVLVLSFVWLLLQRRVARLYVDTLGAALGTRHLFARGRTDEAILDRDGLGWVVRMLGDKDVEHARLAREILAIAAPDTAILASHLAGHDDAIRTVLYEQLAQSPSVASGRELRDAVLAEDPASPAFGAGLDALAAHGDAALVDRARGLATGTVTKSEGSARAAWEYLAQVGGLDDEPAALHGVLCATLVCDGLRAAAMYRAALERGSIDGERVDDDLVAAVTATAPTPYSLHRDRKDRDAAAEVFKAAALLGRSRPIVKLLEALENKRPGAEEALAHLDQSSLARLMLLATARKISTDGRRRILRGLRQCHLPECIDVVARSLDDEDARIRETATRTLLHKAREGEAHVPRQPVERALGRALDRFRVYVSARPPYPSDARDSSIAFRHDAANVLDAEIFFLDELERRTEQVLAEVCESLALLGNPNEIYVAARELRAPRLERRLRAMDILQEVARGVMRVRVFELLERYLQPRQPTTDDRAAVCALDSWLNRCASEELAPLRHRMSGLRTSALFDSVPGEALVELAEQTGELTRRSGEVIVQQDETGDSLYVLMSGRVVVERDGVELARLNGGQTFGEMSLIDGRPRHATVRTLTQARLLCVSRETFHKLLLTYPEARLGLMRTLAAWLR